MAGTQEDDMYLFNSAMNQTPNGFSAGDFDAFLDSAPGQDENIPPDTYLNPNDLVKQESVVDTPSPADLAFTQSHRGSDSSSSSGESGQYHNRQNSEASASSSAVASAPARNWGTGINGMSMPVQEQIFEDTTMSGLEDFEASNRQMASDFDFETAASTPSGFHTANIVEKNMTVQPFRRTATFNTFTPTMNPATKATHSNQPAFFFAGSREASPLNAMLPGVQGQSPWNKHSPSSGLEETFNHITMNGDSPGNVTFLPNSLQFNQGFGFEADSSATPSSFAKDVSSPPSTINSMDGRPQLTVQPTSLKSRVETQIPIKLTLSMLPPGAKKLRLPTHTVSKPKFLAKGEVERSPEILELSTSLVCTSAMQDPQKRERALARARGEDVGQYARPSPASSVSSTSRDDEDKPLNGGEVRICSGCVQRERKRASRKKQKKPDEEEAFQRDEEKRIVVFNTSEIKEWSNGAKESSPDGAPVPTAASPPVGPMHVELPMRIACYCRHQNEKLGFQVIFTIKDFRGKLVAQAMTNSIMITDDHKTHNAVPTVQAPAPLPTAPQLPGAGVFASGAQENAVAKQTAPKMFKQSFSTNDLHGMQQTFNPSFVPSSNNPFAIPSSSSTGTSKTMVPRNLSRPASPSGPSGPTAKKRKQSGSGKLPSGLTMTRLDTSQVPSGVTTMPNSAASTPYAANMDPFMPPIAPSIPAATGVSPPTPNGHDPYATTLGRSFSLENLPRQAMISAPASRQPSRPGSPGSARNSFGAADPNLGQAVTNQLSSHIARRPVPLIHKLVPAEGSVTGGTEVTLLGNGFFLGLEVMFGDTEATTTTFWGEKCLNCIAPPALQPGTVTVVFKHEHPQYAPMQQPSQTRSTVFTYVDDRELEMYRLALRTLGKSMHHPTDDPYSAAQQLLQGGQQSMWPSQGHYGMMGGRQRNAGMTGPPVDTLELENDMLHILEHMDRKAPSALGRLDLQRPSGLTLLHLASSLGLTRFVVGLLSRGANPNVKDNNGHTPMHHAAMNGHTYIIHRLRLQGGHHKARSLRHFTPADLATSLLAYQAALMPSSHYRSRSVGGTPMRLQSRRGSSASLQSFWAQESASQADFDSDETLSDSSEDLSTETMTPAQVANIVNTGLPSRRNSTQTAIQTLPVTQVPVAVETSLNGAPSAYMLAWRDHLVAQLQQFNESAQSVMPSLATLNGPLQALQDYQANPMVRRVSALFPQRPNSRQSARGSREGWWETLTGSTSPPAPTPIAEPSAPPAYDDLYPEQEPSTEDWSVKKQSAMQAATDALADQHFDIQASQSRPAVPRWTKPVNSGQLNLMERRPSERIAFSQDKKLFFFWIPIMLILLGLMARNSGIVEFFMPSRDTGRVLEEINVM